MKLTEEEKMEISENPEFCRATVKLIKQMLERFETALITANPVERDLLVAKCQLDGAKSLVRDIEQTLLPRSKK